MQRTCVLLSTTIPLAAVPLKDTLEHPVRLAPVNVQAVPPAVEPDVGLMADSVGCAGPSPYVYPTPLLTPCAVPTVTVIAPLV